LIITHFSMVNNIIQCLFRPEKVVHESIS